MTTMSEINVWADPPEPGPSFDVTQEIRYLGFCPCYSPSQEEIARNRRRASLSQAFRKQVELGRVPFDSQDGVVLDV